MSIAALIAAPADRYTNEREFGQSGMAIGYLAHDIKHDHTGRVRVGRRSGRSWREPLVTLEMHLVLLGVHVLAPCEPHPDGRSTDAR